MIRLRVEVKLDLKKAIGAVQVLFAYLYQLLPR